MRGSTFENFLGGGMPPNPSSGVKAGPLFQAGYATEHAPRLHIKNQPRRRDNIRSVQTTENERQTTHNQTENQWKECEIYG